MPRLEDGPGPLLGEARERVASAWDGFVDFVFSDNVLEVAVGLMYVHDFASDIS